MSRIVSLLRRTFGIVKEHVGTDHLGNKYYFIPEQKTWTGRTVRAKRTVVAANPVEYEYTEGSIPSEWDAWIRGRRKEPPSVEELQRNMLYREQIKLKAQEFEQKDSALQAEEHEPTHTLIRGHAAATHFKQAEANQDPISTGNTFQPGAWSPPGGEKTTPKSKE